MSSVINEIEGKLNVDPKRIQRARRAFERRVHELRRRLRARDRIAGRLAGATFAKAADCAASEPLRIIQMHGTADDVVEFDGGAVEGIRSSPMGPCPREGRGLGEVRRL